ncbi:MAG: endopeptidase La [Bacteroidales bacterium]|nr:endopeptidase La [Bacteroidales bacterium]MBO7763770.1 endopeptidase La [Bacteroidales bacterium]
MKKDNLLFDAGVGDVNILPVVNMDSIQNLDEKELPEVLPILTLRNAVLFPATVIPIAVGREKSIKLVRDAYKSGKILGAVAQIDNEVEHPAIIDLFDIGTLGRILKIIEMPDGSITAIIQGVKRFKIVEQTASEPYLFAKVNYLNDILAKKNDKEMEAVAENIKDLAMQIIKSSPHLPQEAGFAIKNLEGYEFLTNFIASSMDIDDVFEKMGLLKESHVKVRAMKLLEILNRQMDILTLKNDIQQKVRTEMDQQQREYYLNNQLKTIQEELGIDSEGSDINELRLKAEGKKWPQHAADAFESELRKLERTNVNSPDYNVQYQYVKLLVDLPWDELTQDNLDLAHAQKVLDKDHFGLDSVKERIIEYLAVLKLKGDMKSPILCLYGPPGVGKTSLGKSIARALGRKYGRISLGGLHDESEIRGHRKTYIGAMPGRIIQNIKKAGSSNPVIVLDEIDKISKDFKGDPAYALLEVLDPEQNNTFHDNYLDIDYDLSKVLFITTANNISTIHPALKDRMEMIPVNGYLAEEKVSIAQGYLVPKQLEAHGLKKSQFKINKAAINKVIDEYTRESGVRGLDKQIAKLARVSAKKIAIEEETQVSITPEKVREILGIPTNSHDMQKGNEAPGVVTGLAWTEMGGEILFVECSLSEGKGNLTMTGNLGDVMKESTTIAFQYIKAHPELLNLTTEDIMKRDIHIHVPEGAIPKDGPSAGITMVSAMASAYMGKMVKSKIAMTGEMTLRGKVLPVGGIKEKILAAKRAGIDTIILSKENEKDINEIKEMYIKGLNFIYVNNISEVLETIF